MKRLPPPQDAQPPPQLPPPSPCAVPGTRASPLAESLPKPGWLSPGAPRCTHSVACAGPGPGAGGAPPGACALLRPPSGPDRASCPLSRGRRSGWTALSPERDPPICLLPRERAEAPDGAPAGAAGSCVALRPTPHVWPGGRSRGPGLAPQRRERRPARPPAWRCVHWVKTPSVPTRHRTGSGCRRACGAVPCL